MNKWIFGFSLMVAALMCSNFAFSQKCPKPNGLGVSGISANSATLHWEKSTEHTSYEVTVMHSKNTSNHKQVLYETGNQVTVSGLESGGNYRFRVKASCEKGKGNSKWFEFSTLGSVADTSSVTDSVDTAGGQNGPCPKVVNMAVKDVTDSTATLTWHADDQHVSFRVDIKSKNHTTSYNKTHTTSDTFFILEDLEAGGNYHFRVKASCSSKSAGSSKWIDFSTTGGDSSQVDKPCAKPKNLSVLEVTTSTALLNWYHPDSLAEFYLDIKSGSMTPSLSFSTTIENDSFLVEDLVSEGIYQFRLKATCGDGSISGSSDWAVFKTIPAGDRDTVVTDSLVANQEMENQTLLQDIKPLSESSKNTISVTELTVYPNPATSNVVVEIPEKQLKPSVRIQLIDLTGKVVFEEKVRSQSSTRFTLDIDSLNPGYYKLVVRSGHYFSEKMIYVSG